VLAVVTEWEIAHSRSKKNLSGQVVADELVAENGSAVMLQVEVAAEGGVGAPKKKKGAGKKGGKKGGAKVKAAANVAGAAAKMKGKKKGK
jgi:hypothetical protein